MPRWTACAEPRTAIDALRRIVKGPDWAGYSLINIAYDAWIAAARADVPDDARDAMWSGLYELSIPLTASKTAAATSAAERLVTSEFGAGTEARTVSFKI